MRSHLGRWELQRARPVGVQKPPESLPVKLIERRIMALFPRSTCLALLPAVALAQNSFSAAQQLQAEVALKTNSSWHLGGFCIGKVQGFWEKKLKPSAPKPKPFLLVRHRSLNCRRTLTFKIEGSEELLCSLTGSFRYLQGSRDHSPCRLGRHQKVGRNWASVPCGLRRT